MTAQTTGPFTGSPDLFRQRPAARLVDVGDGRAELVADSTEEWALKAPFEITPPVREVTP
jgi:hypothetical protein